MALLLLAMLTAFGNDVCQKCDISKVKLIHENIDSLTLEIVEDFLCTLDRSCINNVEFSEWSNETIFTILINAPALFFQVMDKGKINSVLILSEIETPIHDLIDLQKVYNNVKAVSTETELKNNVLKSVIKAASNINEEIKR